MTENENNNLLRVLRIIDGTTVDGPGFRTSIYFAGCLHHCPGCHNPGSWDFNAGTPYSVDELCAVIERNDMDVTYSGGDPLYQWEALTELTRRVKDAGRSVWCYTGFEYESLCQRPELNPLLSMVDVLVDGPFVEKLRNIGLHFRGSDNQRLIDLRATQKDGWIAIWQPDTEVF